MIKEITITEERGSRRIDAFLAERIEDRSRGDIARAIKAGAIAVNSLQVKPHYKLKINDVISITQIDAIEEQTLVPNSSIKLTIVDENDHFLVINKPLGLQVHPSTRGETDTLANGLLAYFPTIKTIGDDPLRPGIMHRLDKDTSGLMVIAKDQDTFAKLKEAFKMREIQKSYTALVWGTFEEEEGVIDAPIARAKSYTKQKIAHGKFGGDAKEALTHYNVLEKFKLPAGRNRDPYQISLLEVLPRTGRMHQIRVHLAHIQHPLIGDTKYCTKNEYDKNLAYFETLPTEMPHTFRLHAAKLSFLLNDQKYTYERPLPKYFLDLISTRTPIVK